MTHVVILFAYHFPPELEIGAARPFRFYKYLNRLGYSCKVITAVPQSGKPLPGVVYVPDPFLAPDHRGLRWQIERAIRKILLPGVVGIGWSLEAFRAAQALLRAESSSRVTVISTFPPLGVHFAAWRLARTQGLPWIADFRDPLGGKQLLNEVSVLQTRFRRWLERRILRAADVVIANTDASQQHWQREHPDRADRIHVVWNGYDPENRIAAKPLPPRPYKVLCHTGSLYGDRTIGPILASIGRLIDGGKIPLGTLRLRHVGNAEPAPLGDPVLLARAQSQGWLELTTHAVPQPEVHALMQTSDYLLLILPHSPLQASGKLFEYLQIGRPILAFVLPDSPVVRILAQSGVPHRCVHAKDSPERMDEVIAEFLNLPTTITPANRWFEETFNGEVQTRALAAIVEKTGTAGTPG